MWTRFHIKCKNCDKITNLRLQIPEKEKLKISLNCLGCSSQLEGILFVDFNKPSWNLKIERGELVNDDFFSGDFFHEFSDTLITNKPSTNPHELIMPTLRLKTSEFEKIVESKNKKNLHPKEVWDDLKDLANAYARFDKIIIEKLVKKILGNIYSENIFKYNIELDYHRNYFLSLNLLIYPWIDFKNHASFVEWLNKNIFNETNLNNADLLDFVQNIHQIMNLLKLEKR